MTTIALCGDSTHQTMYLRAASNAALVSAHKLPADFDGSLGPVLKAALASLGITATVTNYSLGGWDSYDALYTLQSIYGTNTPQFTACKTSNPDIMLIGFGANITRGATPHESFRDHITRMISECLAANITPVLANNFYNQYGPVYDQQSLAYNATHLPLWEIMQELAETFGLLFIDLYERSRWHIETLGQWDLFGRNDSSYFAGWENGSNADEVAYYNNCHQWIEGTKIMADEIAQTLKAYEPKLGGRALPVRSQNGRMVRGARLVPVEIKPSIANATVKYRTAGAWKPCEGTRYTD